MAGEEISLNELAAEFETRTRVSYRLMLRRTDRIWTLQSMMIDVRVAPTVHVRREQAHTNQTWINEKAAGVTAGGLRSIWLHR